jgi:hypothetical protein
MSPDRSVPATGKEFLGPGAFLEEDAAEAVDDMEMDHGMERFRSTVRETARHLGGDKAVLPDDGEHLFPGLAGSAAQDGSSEDRIEDLRHKGLSVKDFQLFPVVQERVDDLGGDPADDGKQDQESGGQTQQDEEFLLPDGHLPAAAVMAVTVGMAMAVTVTAAVFMATV